jgi:CheY-like chemotaxis protein
MARILVIEDDVAVRLTIKAILKRRGHNVVLAECGRRGLAVMELFSFDTIIVDIFMPGMNGMATIKAVSDIAPHVPVIAISGSLPNLLDAAAAFGADVVLRKPFNSWELIEAVERHHDAAASQRIVA